MNRFQSWLQRLTLRRLLTSIIVIISVHVYYSFILGGLKIWLDYRIPVQVFNVVFVLLNCLMLTDLMGSNLVTKEPYFRIFFFVISTMAEFGRFIKILAIWNSWLCRTITCFCRMRQISIAPLCYSMIWKLVALYSTV